MRKGLNPIQSERKPSAKTQGTGDLYKAFSSLEEEILSLQSLIEKNKAKHFPEIYSVRSSRSDLHPISKLLSVCTGETPNSLQQHRNSVLVEPTYHLLSSCLGPQYSNLHPDTALRLLALKSKFQEILFKKLSESLLFVCYSFSLNTNANELIPNLINLVESLENKSPSNPTSDIELQSLKEEISRKEQLLSSNIANLQRTEKTLKEKDGALEYVKSQVEKHVQTIRNLEKEMESLGSENQGQIGKIKAEFEMQLKNCQEQIKKLRTEVSSEKEKSKKLEETYSTNSKEELNTLKEKYDSLSVLHKNTITEKDTEIATLTTNLSEIHETLKQSSGEIQSKDSDLLEISGKLDTLKTEYKKQEEKYGALLEKYNIEVKQGTLAEQSKQSAEQENQKLREFLDKSNEKLQKALEQISNTPKTDPATEKELATLKRNLTSVEENCAEKVLENQELSTSLKAMQIELKYMQETNDRLQDQLAKLSDDYDEDTFEHVMRHELSMMREAYEKKIEMIRQEHEEARKKILFDIKDLKAQLVLAEHSRDMAEFRLRSFKNI